MSEENTKTVRLMESFTTYECHGDIKLNLDIFPELKDKTNQEIQTWLNENSGNLYIDCYSQELRKDQYYIYSQEELDDMLVNGEDPEIDDSVIELSEYWSNTEVIWDKIKCEEKTLHVQ
jgi:hypothetical protein